MRTAIQLYTLRHLDEPIAKTFERVADTPLDAVEFGLNDTDLPETREALDEAGLDVANLMAGVGALEEPETELVETCDALDCETVILGYLDESYFESVAAVEETAAMLSRFARTLDDHGLQFLYHNHDHEFVEVDGRCAFDILLEEMDERVGFELDLGWVGTGGGDPYARLAELGDRIPSVHVKDMHFESGEFAELGEGDLDVHRAVETARRQDAEWVIYEHDDPSDSETSLHHGSTTLTDAVRETNADSSRE